MKEKTEAKVINIDINQIRYWASQGCTIGEIADMLDISYQVLQQYYNKGKGRKIIKNYAFYRSIYKAINYGRQKYKNNIKDV